MCSTGWDGVSAIEAYDASSITVLSGLQAVRRRPAMYIGTTGPQGILNLLFEVVQNAIDEALVGCCTDITLVVGADGSYTVEDNGRGIPVDPHPVSGRPACEVVLTRLHSGGKFGRGAYSVAGGLHGVGISCVNALSEWLRLEVRREGYRFEQQFSRGEVTRDLERTERVQGSGTRVHFLPDRQIFTDTNPVPFEVLSGRLQDLAFLHPGVCFWLDHQPAGKRERYAYETGIEGFVEHLNASLPPLHSHPIRLTGEHGEVAVDLALQWTTGYAEKILTYVNSIFTSQGGTHLEGLKSALTRVMNRYALSHGFIRPEADEKTAGYDIREGLTSVLSVVMPEPEFEGQTKSILTSTSAMVAVNHLVTKQLSAFLEANTSLTTSLVGKALEASRARAAARRASERARYQNLDSKVSKEVYQKQFGIRSKNWHESARWITDQTLLTEHVRASRVGRESLALDVCCGSGVVGASFRDQVGTVIGLDLTPEMIAQARTRLDRICQGDVYNMPFADGSFDLVFTREVLHLFPHPERPVGEIFRVLKPGGQFVVGQIMPYGIADLAWMFRIFKKKQPLFFNNFTEESFRALLVSAGFRDIQMAETFQWEDIDLWIDTHETPNLSRHEIRDLYYHAPAEVRAIHPFEVLPSGAIRDCWRWGVFSATKPSDSAEPARSEGL